MKAIREGSTKRVLSMLEDVAENEKDKYAAFWEQFGAVLKEGVGEDHANQERLAKLLRFASTHGRQRRLVRRLREPHEGRPGGDLLHHRRQPGRGARTARSSRSSARRASRCCC